MPMQRIVLVGVLSIVACGAAWSQENRGTREQQMACTPDVWRLCSDRIPDVGAITACLRASSSQLSPGCRAAFEANEGGESSEVARAAPQVQPRARTAAPPPPARPQGGQRPANAWYD